MSEPSNCFLESPTRGVVVALPGDRDEKFHFSWSKPRTTAIRMTLTQARYHTQHPQCPKGVKIMRPNPSGIGYDEVA